jgi:RNA polymerase sigma factor (sigma-70 family)
MNGSGPSFDGFEDWYRSAHPSVLASLVLVTGDVHVATEATDEAFARALAHWRRVQSMESRTGWTVRVAVNAARRKARRQSLERTLLNRSVDIQQPPGDAFEAWDIVRELPDRERLAVVLRYAMDLTELDVAAALGTSRSSTSTLLTQARRRLAILFSDSQEVPSV